jgi:hypothetical protein
MSLFKFLSKKKVTEVSLESKIEDVRKSKQEAGEVILNLWYITDKFVISSLRSMAYVASGTDEEKIAFLKLRSKTDFAKAKTHEVPNSLKANIELHGDNGKVSTVHACTHQSLDFMGGYDALFRDIIKNTPTYGFTFDPTNVLICRTALLKGNDGTLTPQISS